MIVEPEWGNVGIARLCRLFRAPVPRCFLPRRALAAGAHETNGQELIELGHRLQQRNPSIEMRAGPEVDEFLPVDLPMRHGHEAWNAEIAGDIEDPEPPAGFRQLYFQITDVSILKLGKVQLRAVEAVVPPDCIGIPLHQLEE